MKKQKAFTLLELAIVIAIMAILLFVLAPIFQSTPEPETTKTIKVTTSKMEAYYDLETLNPTSDRYYFNESGETLRLEFGDIGWIEISGHRKEETDGLVTTAKILAIRDGINVVTGEELTSFAEKQPLRSNPDGKTVIKLFR